MPGSVMKALLPDYPASPASATPPPKTSMKTRGTLWPSSLDGLGVGERRLDDQADARLLQHQPDRDQHRHRDEHHEAAVHRVLRAHDREQRPVQVRRHAVRHGRAAPDEVRRLLDEIGEAEGEEQLGDVAVFVRAAKREALDRHAERADRERRQHERRPEADPAADLVREVGAEHVEARVREVEHAHQREDDGEARGKHEQQQPVADAVQGLTRKIP
jgi:hypothetical protein